ncbi:Gfo/Idh/MocA family protein [Paenibacillus sp. 2TAB23]|uniref:Gfo/Idh/MocA family protein n=1 Tax=Paenibacillus sp. 2TAB23 TaxID=3233004 RepID=UPI003F957486
MSIRKQTKIALIGAGGWGYHHARIFQGRQEVDFCAIVGRDESKTTARAAEFGTRAYTDIASMLERENPDMVSLCLPNQGHFDATLQIIQAGVPLLVEKPLVFGIKEAETLLEAAEKKGLFFAINFNHRYAVPVQQAKAAIDAGRLGDLVFAAWRFGGEGDGGHPHANLIETQCHGFDTLEYLCGPIRSVMAQMTNKMGNGFSTLALALEFESGAVGTLLGSYDSSYAYAGTHVLELNGSLGRATIEDTVKRYTFQQAGNETAEVWQAGYFNDADRQFHLTFDKHFDHLLQAFQAGAAPPVHASAGFRALRLAYAAIESFESGKRISTR